MIILPMNTITMPEGAKGSAVVDGELQVYFADDPEVINEELHRLRINKHVEINQLFNKAERSLSVSKNEYRDMQAASVVGLAHKDLNPAETMKAFKDAFIARQTIQTKRDTLLAQVNAAATVEEIEAIQW